MTPTRDSVLASAAWLERDGQLAAAEAMRALLAELERTAAALALLTDRFAEIARERDELVLTQARRR